jgi:hypothetical protein
VPVIREIPRDPTDLVIQGEQAVTAALASPVGGVFGPMPPAVVLIDPLAMQTPLIEDEDLDYGIKFLGDTVLFGTVDTLWSGTGLIRNNACISTPCGALIPFDRGVSVITNLMPQGTDQFTITGTTVDKNGSALASCFVSVEETARQNIPGQDVVAQTTSDGSGAFSVTVPMNTLYQLEAYKAGSPDLAGITKNSVTPGGVTIYLRDPTTADSAGAGSGMSRGRVVN